MRTKTILMLAGMMNLVFMPIKTLAVEALTTEELVSHCEFYAKLPDSTDGVFCVRYIQGFIDGAVITDARVTLNIADELDREESYTERAMRTRLSSRLNQYGPSVYADFCLGKPIPLKSVVDDVIKNLLKPAFIRNKELAREVVYQTLRENYPCELNS